MLKEDIQYWVSFFFVQDWAWQMEYTW